jgi:hypothetical protein
VGGGVQTGSTRHVGHWMAYCTCPGWLWWWRICWNEDSQGKPKYSEETCPSATSSTTNPTWPDPGLNPGRRGGKSATNRLSYGTVSTLTLINLHPPASLEFFRLKSVSFSLHSCYILRLSHPLSLITNNNILWRDELLQITKSSPLRNIILSFPLYELLTMSWALTAVEIHIVILWEII